MKNPDLMVEEFLEEMEEELYHKEEFSPKMKEALLLLLGSAFKEGLEFAKKKEDEAMKGRIRKLKI
jgi:hypothetical protein